MRSVLFAVLAAGVFAGPVAAVRAAAETPATPPAKSTKAGDAPAAAEGAPAEDGSNKWIIIGAAAGAVALAGVLAARAAKAKPTDAPPAA